VANPHVDSYGHLHGVLVQAQRRPLHLYKAPLTSPDPNRFQLINQHMATFNSNAPRMPLVRIDEGGYNKHTFRVRASLLRLLAAACSGPMAAFAVPAVAATQTPDAQAREALF